MGGVVAAVSAVAKAFAATKLGTFLTTTFVGKLLSSVAISALRAAIARSNRPRDPGIRTSNTLTGGVTAASFILGLFATEGQLLAPPMSHSVAGERVPNSMLTYVIELGDIPGQTLEGLILDGEQATIGTGTHPDYGNEIEGRFQDKAWIRYYDGSQTAADPDLVSLYGSDPERPWQSDMVGEGIPYAIVTFKFDREVFQNFPRTRFIKGGIPRYDPRLDSTVGGSGSHRWNYPATWAQTHNPMVMIYNILRGIEVAPGRVWGGKCKPAALPLAQWFAAMNACDAEVDLDGGGTEPAFRAGFEVFCDDEPADIIDELLKACSAEIAEVGGRFIPRVGGPGLPVYFFTDDDIALDDPRESDPYPLPDETYNIVTAVAPDPAALWEPREAPPREDTDAIAADGSPNIADLDLSAVPYPLQVQRIMEAALREERRFARHVLSLPSDAIGLEPLDAVSWTGPRHDYDGKVFEVTGIVDPILTGRPRLSLRERDAADSVWTPADEIANPAPSAVPGSIPIHVIKPTLDELGDDVQALLAAADAAAADLDALTTGFTGTLVEMRDALGEDMLATGSETFDAVAGGAALTRDFTGIIGTANVLSSEVVSSGLGPVVRTTGTGRVGARKAYGAIPGRTYEITARARVQTDETSPSGFQRRAFISAAGLDSTGAFVSTPTFTTPPEGGVRVIDPFIASASWTEFKTRFTVPTSGWVYWRPSFTYGASGSTGTWDFVWIEIEDVTEGSVIRGIVDTLQGDVGGLAADYSNIVGFELSELTGTAFGAFLTSMEVSAGGNPDRIDDLEAYAGAIDDDVADISSEVSIQGSAIADIEGNGSAALVFKATSGGATASIDIVAFNNAGAGTPFGSKISITSDWFAINGNAAVDGTFHAVKIVAGSITTDRISVNGVERPNLIDEAVNEQPQLALGTAALYQNNTTVFTFSLGAHGYNHIWHHNLSLEWRSPQGGSGFPGQLIFERRVMPSFNGGVWEGWVTLATSPADTNDWQHWFFSDEYIRQCDDVELRLRLGGGHVTVTRNNIRRLVVLGVAPIK